jgi:hypothetical protein
VRAKFDFLSTAPGDLHFKKGAFIRVSDGTHPDWWDGTIHTASGNGNGNDDGNGDGDGSGGRGGEGGDSGVDGGRSGQFPRNLVIKSFAPGWKRAHTMSYQDYLAKANGLPMPPPKSSVSSSSFVSPGGERRESLSLSTAKAAGPPKKKAPEAPAAAKTVAAAAAAAAKKKKQGSGGGGGMTNALDGAGRGVGGVGGGGSMDDKRGRMLQVSNQFNHAPSFMSFIYSLQTSFCYHTLTHSVCILSCL